jgi:hypothetical protein
VKKLFQDVDLDIVAPHIDDFTLRDQGFMV